MANDSHKTSIPKTGLHNSSLQKAELAKYQCRLMQNHWFASLPAGLKELMLQQAEWRQLQAGEILFYRGDRSDGVYAVLEGAMNIGSMDEQGRETLLLIAEPVVWFGEICLVDDLPRTHHAVAACPTVLLKIDQHRLRNSLNQQPEYWRYIALLLSQKLRLTLQSVEALAIFPASQRLAQRLLHMAEGYGHREIRQSQLKISQERLALMLSLSRQTTNSLLKAFEEKQLIRLGFWHD